MGGGSAVNDRGMHQRIREKDWGRTVYSGLIKLECLEGRRALAQHAAEARCAVCVRAVERADRKPPQRAKCKPRTTQAVVDLATRVVELQECECDGGSVAPLQRGGQHPRRARRPTRARWRRACPALEARRHAGCGSARRELRGDS